MKRLLIIALISILPIILLGQAPQAINYQTVVRDADNQVIYDTDVDFKLEIIKDGVSIFTEYHNNQNTGDFGIVNLQVGTQNPQDFSEIDWSQGPYQLKVWLNGEEVGVSDLVSVPYALYAEKAGGDWVKNELDSSLHYLDGNIGIGTGNPITVLHVIGDMIRLDGVDDADLNLNIPSVSLNNPEVRFLVDDEEKGHVRLKHHQEYLSIHENLSDNSTQMSLRNGNVGIGMISPSDPLDVKGLIRVRGDNTHQKLRFYAASSEQDNRINSYDENGDLMWQILMGWRAEEDCFAIYRPGNNVPTEFKVDINGMTHVRTLQIHGGADITEPFEMSSNKTYPEGSLVVIDSENIGKLTISNQAYDKRIAGVISGAGGVNPGISLQQEGVMENGQQVALAGRVYVLASAVNGAIQPGDLLTTSDIPGYAMKATKKKKRQGAVIGKAMSELKEGEGLVLVLVNLL